jgi:hypothetical protein
LALEIQLVRLYWLLKLAVAGKCAILLAAETAELVGSIVAVEKEA